MGSRGLNEATITRTWGGCIERPPGLQRAGCHVGDQANLTFFTSAQRLGTDDACVVDRGARQCVDGLGRQVNESAIGLDGATVLDQCVHRAPGDLQLHRTTQIQGDGAASAQKYLTTVCVQLSIVGDFCCDQRDGPALAGLAHGRDVALVDDGVGAVPGQFVIAGHEVLGAHPECGCDQRTRIHLCRGSEQYAVGVEQKHLPVGLDRALDDRDIGAQNTVQGHCAGGRLHKVHRLALAHREALPVDGHFGSGLLDRHRAGILCDGA